MHSLMRGSREGPLGGHLCWESAEPVLYSTHLLLVGDIDQYHLNDLSRKTERYINRKIRSLVFSRDEYRQMEPKFKDRPRVLIWQSNWE
jgi:hypothetical protein